MTSFSPWLASHTGVLMLWLGGFCTLALYSLLYKENRLYRVVEHIYLGLATGYTVATQWTDVVLPKWWKPLWDKGEWWQIIVLLVALMYYFIYSEKLQWLARLAIGFFLGVTSGRAFQEFANDIWPQVPASFKPIIPHGAIAATAGHPAVKALNLPDALNNLIFMVIIVCVMSYFFFSFEQKNPLVRGSAKWGRWLMMFAFGAIFGSTVMARLALLIDRVDFLLNDFSPSIFGLQYGPILMFIILMGLAAYIVARVIRTGPDESTDQ